MSAFYKSFSHTSTRPRQPTVDLDIVLHTKINELNFYLGSSNNLENFVEFNVLEW